MFFHQLDLMGKWRLSLNKNTENILLLSSVGYICFVWNLPLHRPKYSDNTKYLFSSLDKYWGLYQKHRKDYLQPCLVRWFSVHSLPITVSLERRGEPELAPPATPDTDWGWGLSQLSQYRLQAVQCSVSLSCTVQLLATGDITITQIIYPFRRQCQHWRHHASYILKFLITLNIEYLG